MALSRSQFVPLALTLLLFVEWASHALSRPLDEVHMVQRHQDWMAQHGRVYVDAAEREMRYGVFRDNVNRIEALNKDPKRTYKLGVNMFADLTNEEFRASRTGYKMSPRVGKTKTTSFGYENVTAVPAAVDWRKKGAVTHVKDQGSCGCCWAFSAVAAMEGAHMLKTGKLVSLSEQQVVDCDVHGTDMGCSGGLMDSAFDFIESNHGLTTDSSYPYTATDGGACKTPSPRAVASISGHVDVPENDEAALALAVAGRPVSVAIEAGGFDFQFYSSGLFTGACGTYLDHGVTAVGYGSAGPKKFWLVKNSWGAGWGEGGYIRMQKDVKAKEGLCGIAMMASYPIAA